MKMKSLQHDMHLSVWYFFLVISVVVSQPVRGEVESRIAAKFDECLMLSSLGT